MTRPQQHRQPLLLEFYSHEQEQRVLEAAGVLVALGQLSQAHLLQSNLFRRLRSSAHDRALLMNC